MHFAKNKTLHTVFPFYLLLFQIFVVHDIPNVTENYCKAWKQYYKNILACKCTLVFLFARNRIPLSIVILLMNKKSIENNISGEKLEPQNEITFVHLFAAFPVLLEKFCVQIRSSIL